MRKNFHLKTFLPVVAILALLTAGGIAYPMFKPATPKIGYVNINAVARNLGLLDQAVERIHQARTESDRELITSYQKLGAALESWEIRQTWVSDATIARLNREIDQCRKNLAHHKARIDNEIFDLELKLKADIKEKVNQRIQAWADMNGYDVIHSVSENNRILNQVPELDVTEMLQRDLLASR